MAMKTAAIPDYGVSDCYFEKLLTFKTGSIC